MATVKGDVHDIGKNIVGVVLGCNDYEVIDLGVMVPVRKDPANSPQAAGGHDRPVGLITPSLDEMVHVASEMEREGFEMPLLIGGATTSAKHTAVKIAPAYHETVVHVKDASRSVGVVERLDQPRAAAQTAIRKIAGSSSKERETFAKRRQRQAGDLCRGVPAAFRHRLEGGADRRARRSWGRAVLRDFPLGEIAQYIDWSPFFMTWEHEGQISGDPRRSLRSAARLVELFDDAKQLLAAHHARKAADGQRRSMASSPPTATATTSSSTPTTRRDEGARASADAAAAVGAARARPVFRSLADYVAPVDSGVPGLPRRLRGDRRASAPTSWSQRFDADHDDYNAIMAKALADRLAEAFAELLHERARRDWGYGKHEKLSKDELIEEKYRGIRPAAGYPSCPDHTEKSEAVGPAGRGVGSGHSTDGELCHDAGGVGQRLVFRPSRRASISPSI